MKEQFKAGDFIRFNVTHSCLGKIKGVSRNHRRALVELINNEFIISFDDMRDYFEKEEKLEKQNE
jgi:hypothetical protein